jgi:hypothetical protein
MQEFQWYKTQHRSVAETQNNLLESTIKTPIAFGTQMIHKVNYYLEIFNLLYTLIHFIDRIPVMECPSFPTRLT